MTFHIQYLSDGLWKQSLSNGPDIQILPNRDGKTITVTDNTTFVTVSKYVTENLSWTTRFLVVCDLYPSLILLIMWGSKPSVTVSTADISVLHSAEVLHFHHNSRKSSEELWTQPRNVLARHNTTLPRCDCIGTLRGLYKDSLTHDNPLRFQVKAVITLS